MKKAYNYMIQLRNETAEKRINQMSKFEELVFEKSLNINL